MGDKSITLGNGLEVVADVVGAHLGDAGARHLDGSGADLVKTGGTGGGGPGHPTIVPHRVGGL
ncbi:hypothetical protein GCM10029963_41650 [Micromonospora andamanensis]|uniref:Type A2 lantipeptide n=1 Tax=Micromonospora andamanensis TaxID=1287068 RepID=A0ABQ4HRB9_9ACTN|nr:hypothetical protein Van01_14040 [Micromonospora andamanensis]GIJ37037.1 hypothetical protein Vwe01_03620 [Micromonospora andamanensis]